METTFSTPNHGETLDAPLPLFKELQETRLFTRQSQTNKPDIETIQDNEVSGRMDQLTDWSVDEQCDL